MTKLKAIEESRVFSTDELRLLRTDSAMYYRLNDLEYSRELNDQDIKIKTQLGIDYIEFYCLQLLNKSDRTPEESRYLIGIRNKLIEDFKNKNFAYINKAFIDRYCEWNAQRRLKGNANARLTQFNIVFYGDNGIRTIDTRIDSNPNVAESEIVDEIRELSSFVPRRR